MWGKGREGLSCDTVVRHLRLFGEVDYVVHVTCI